MPRLLTLLLFTLALPLLPAQDQSVKPGINKKFLADPQPPEWVERFEKEGREVYDQREAIVAACALEPGDRVADIGAGTGLFTRLFAPAVGPKGTVYAVDIAKTFVTHTVMGAHARGFKQVEGVVCKQDDVSLPPNSIDLAFVCATYHHFEFPFKSLASIHKALAPGGRLVVVDFERIEGKSSDFILGHVRANKETVLSEIEKSGFTLASEAKDLFKENYLLTFNKSEKPAAEPLTTFVFAGQSNMVGKRSRAADLPEQYQGTQENVFIFTGEQWEPYRPGLGQKGGFGPEVSAALDLANALGKPVGIIKHSIGGTNLALQWNPAKANSLYTTLAKKVAAARAARPIKIAGAFWMQGGADARRMEMAKAYSQNLDALIATMRADFKNPNLPVVSGRTSSLSSKPNPRYPGAAAVHAAQVQQRPHYNSVPCSDLTRAPDQIHFDTNGITELGNRMATAMTELLNPSSKN